ncbi:MAG: class I SAM-dependent methyltransferase [Lentisphaerota bacterium]
MKDPEIDWIQLWNGLVKQREEARRPESVMDAKDRWSVRAGEYDTVTQRRWAHKDTSREFLVSLLKSLPEPTLLDIGAGGGKWTVPLAPFTRQVTAVEPSPAMRERLQQHLARQSITNVTVVPEAWPCADLPVHDITLCSHSMYGFSDFRSFIDSLQAITKHTCVLLMRAPPLDGIMADAARHIFGHPCDSVNFQIAFNALLQMGLFPNVLMEDPRTWNPWTHDSVADALIEVKRRLRLYDDTTHDIYLTNLLNRRLVRTGDKFVWPCGTHSALVYWRVHLQKETHE